LQGALVLAFGGEAVRGVGCDECRVGRRIPQGVIDAVQNATQRIGTMAKQWRQSVAEGFILNLAGVGRADGGDQRRQLQAGLEEGKLAVEFDAIEAPGVRGRPRACKWLAPKLP
jgi:hypothetical protein